MLLLGITLVLRSQDDQVSALNQADASESVSAAESGVNRVRAFLNRYRALAVLPSGSWNGSVTNVLESCNANSVSSDLGELQPSGSDWPDVDPTDASRGEFRLLSYTYAADTSGTPNAPLGTGTLEVQGRINAGDAISQIQVEIPINPVRKQTAGLWVGGTIAGNSVIDADVIAPCGSSPSVSLQASNDLLRTNLTMPGIPSQPGSNVNTLTSITDITLPEPGNIDSSGVIDGSDTYQYVVPTLDGSFEISEGSSVEIWVTGDIDLSALSAVHYCGASASCGPFNATIYGVGSTSTGTPTITLDRGTSICDIFFHAPTYNVTFNNTTGGTPVDCGAGTRNTGVFWVNNWTDNTSSAVVLDAPRASWQAAPTQPLPQMAPIADWQTEQAQ
ncbi:hypothetical protein C1752_02700 [Acaryochloris thomasi RCC1774]|uniref:Uncharacterized protein n=2 Tax=Acaryochloris TaxID=155977 RepID=A0A2W1JHC8_9CYAN|nr:hypothetical protein C1752_02700 [Acaryochloris thomasi RCC1774]